MHFPGKGKGYEMSLKQKLQELSRQIADEKAANGGNPTKKSDDLIKEGFEEIKKEAEKSGKNN